MDATCILEEVLWIWAARTCQKTTTTKVITRNSLLKQQSSPSLYRHEPANRYIRSACARHHLQGDLAGFYKVEEMLDAGSWWTIADRPRLCVPPRRCTRYLTLLMAIVHFYLSFSFAVIFAVLTLRNSMSPYTYSLTRSYNTHISILALED